MQKMRLINIPVNVIRPCKQHWKRDHNEDEVQRIADEIASVGLIHPVTVRIVDSRPELLAGRKRLIAMRDLLKMTEVPAIIVETDDLQAELLSLYENLGQSEMTPADIDKANSRAVALEAKKNGTAVTPKVIDTVALKTRQKPEEVKKSIKRTSQLIAAAKKALREGKISKSQADELVKMDPPTQMTMLEEMLEKGTSYKKIRDKRIASKGGAGKDDQENANVRLASRMLGRCIVAGNSFKKELTLFNDFVTDKKVKLQKLGGVKNTSPLAAVAEELSATRKLLRH